MVLCLVCAAFDTFQTCCRKERAGSNWTGVDLWPGNSKYFWIWALLPPTTEKLRVQIIYLLWLKEDTQILPVPDLHAHWLGFISPSGITVTPLPLGIRSNLPWAYSKRVWEGITHEQPELLIWKPRPKPPLRRFRQVWWIWRRSH